MGIFGSKNSQANRIYSESGKSVTLSANGGGLGAKTGIYSVALRNRGFGKRPEVGDIKDNCLTTAQTDSMVTDLGLFRKLTLLECLRLQSMPDNYFDGAIANNKPLSDSQKYKMCGNAFNCKVIEHIFSYLPK